MEQQKVNITSSMKKKGYSSSSHYRISSVVDESERLMATKFVQWEVEPLDRLRGRVYGRKESRSSQRAVLAR